MELKAYVVKRGDGLPKLLDPSHFNVPSYLLSKHKENRQLMMGNNQGKNKGFEGQGLQNGLSGLRKKAWREQSMSERAHRFRKTSGGDLLREVSR